MSTVKACGKVRFAAYHDAQMALVEIIIARNMAIESGSKRRLAKVAKRRECRFYRCQRCNGYHLTSEKWIPRELRSKESP